MEDAEDYQKDEFKRFLYKKGVPPDNERAIRAANRMERCLETKKLIHLGSGDSGSNIKEYSMAAWATRKILQVLDTIVPSSRTNAPHELDVDFDQRKPEVMMNDGFWKKAGAVGNVLGHFETSGSAALADGLLALPPLPPPPLPLARPTRFRSDSRSPSRGRHEQSRSRTPPTSRQNPRDRWREPARARSPPTRQAPMSRLRRDMLESISKEAESFQAPHKLNKYERIHVRDIETSGETIETQTYHEMVHLLQMRRLDKIPPLVVIKFVQAPPSRSIHVAVFGNAQLQAAKDTGEDLQLRCVVYEDATFEGEKVPAALACKLVLQSPDPMACLVRFLANKRHAAYDPAENGESVLNKFRDNLRHVDVDDIRHSHDTVNMHFAHGAHKGQSVQTLVEDLVSGKLAPKAITPLVLLKFEERKYWAIFGNRRLKALTLGETFLLFLQ